MNNPKYQRIYDSYLTFRKEGYSPTVAVQSICAVVGRKMKHTGFELWDDCINGDPEAWEMMRMYNRQDVLLLERVYLKLCPYMQNHPNMNILSEIEEGCPVCASANIIRKGFSITSTGKKRRYNCLDCGAWAVGKHTKVTDIR